MTLLCFVFFWGGGKWEKGYLFLNTAIFHSDILSFVSLIR